MYMYIFLSPFVPPYIQKNMFNKDIRYYYYYRNSIEE